MPRRKKLPTIPDYVNSGKKPDALVVQKSNPLLSLSETDLSLSEFKILDAYLGRINSHEPDKRFVVFEKGKLEELLGVVKINQADLEKRIDNLFQTITIRDKNKSKGFCKIALFERAECSQDENGIWRVELSCTPAAMEYVFNVERLHYLRYALKDVIRLTSRYSYILYLYLENNRRMHLSWEVTVVDLKALLRCTADSYKSYKEFNDKILKKGHKELNEKTTCHFTYQAVKKGRCVVAIRFTLEPRNMPIDNPNAEIPGQLGFKDLPEISSDTDTRKIKFLQGACCIKDGEPEFSEAEMEQIFEILVTIPDFLLPENVPTGGLEFRRYHYLAERYAAMNRIAAQKPIKNRFAYFVKMLRSDAGTVEQES